MVLELPIQPEQRNEILDCLRCLSDIVDVRLPRMPSRQEANANRDIDIAYLLNQITKEEWGIALERKESVFEKNKEIGLILQTLVHVGSEKLALLYNTQSRRTRYEMVQGILEDMKKVRDFTNRSLWAKGQQMNMVIPYINKEWRYTMIRKNLMNDPLFIDDRAFPEAVILPAAEEAEPAPEEPPRVAVPLEENDTASEDSGDALIYVEMQNGEIIEMPLREARQLIFHDKTAALVGI
jgi:hypothetical protein